MVYEVGPITGRDLSIMTPTAGEARPVPYLHTPFNEWWGRFAPEPKTRWTAYQSDESGRWEIYVDSYPAPGSCRQISTDGGQFPHWGPDGRELFFVAPDYTLMVSDVRLGITSVESSAPRPLFRLPAVDTGRSPYEVAPIGQRF